MDVMQVTAPMPKSFMVLAQPSFAHRFPRARLKRRNTAPCVGKLVAGGVETVAGATEEHQDSSLGSSARIGCGGGKWLMLGSILRQRELLRAIVSLHRKSECSFAVAWRKGDEGRLEKSTLLVYQADYSSKEDERGFSGLINKLLIVGAPFNHRIDDGHERVS